MHELHETLGSVIKSARTRNNMTMEALAEKLDISERYLYRIENENKKPSFVFLNKIVHELAIEPELIFYPENPSKDSDVENLIRMLYDCDDRSKYIIKATVKAVLESQGK